jgi:hypothetical protein
MREIVRTKTEKRREQSLVKCHIKLQQMKTLSRRMQDAEMCCGRHTIGYQAANLNSRSIL